MKEITRWIARTGRAETPVGAILNAIEAAEWIYEYAPYVVAYFDPPKKLAELQAGVVEAPRKGYDVHHIVERSGASDLTNPIPRFLLESPDNLVRIPTLRHWELNRWYETPNLDYENLTPRAYLRGKSWIERFRVGEEGLREVKVLRR